MGDVDAEVLTVLLRFRAPNFPEDEAMGENAAGMANEQPKKRVLRRGELHLASAAGHHARGEIDDQIAVLED